MTLRSRFTLAVAGAVAAVALAVTAVAFLVVRADLTGQVKHELRQQAAAVEQLARHYHGHLPAGWVPRDSGRFGASAAYAQVVTAAGAVWTPAGDTGMLPKTTAASQVASGQRSAYYTEATMDGVHAMVLTTPLAPGLAVQLAVPLNVVDTEVGSIGATLALLSAAGIGLAALAGWAVARAGLAPVGHLAAVAEQVTATGDPDQRVEVDRADELGRLAASFNTMLGALQRSLAAQRQLVSDASHELRTPLTSLSINAELLAAEPGMPEAERREVLDRVVAQVAELSQLVAGVTELARGDTPSGGDTAGTDTAGTDTAGTDTAGTDTAGTGRGAREARDSAPGGADLAAVDFAEVAAAALNGARRDWPRAVFAVHLEQCAVSADPERLKTAVRNVLDNAAKFSPPGRPIEVRLQAGELTVRDHGTGIPRGDLPYVFDRFYRAASARGVPGSGLGLAIVRQVAEGHGGTVGAEVPADGGTLIRLRLPCPGAAGAPDVALARSLR
jgi:two-component system sensor histidine kinase MprB